MPPSLPIEHSLPRLRELLRDAHRVVLSAAPGAGKTTRVPLALMQEPWLRDSRLIMLEPRRLAAQRAAAYMASLLGEEPGRTVGYRIRGETRVSAATRIEVVTEGVLTRLLHAQPDLPGVGLVIFDEFHERSIHADLGLALCLDVQTHLRDDLRLLIMSATLDGVALSNVLHDAPVLSAEGKSFPVETHYLPFPARESVERVVVRYITRALGEAPGDILVFLPGQGEIHKVESMLRDAQLPEQTTVKLLYGDASPEAQRDALSTSARRKVILSTSIAETSLTIDGVATVIDAGLARSARFDPRRGMSGLVTVPVSLATADQRRGRAGRQSKGVCYRLWTKEQHAALAPYPTPEIQTADLAPMALDLARWGNPEGHGLRFIDPPPDPHLSQAITLLNDLGALDARGALTSHGRAMADLPVHPRLAHMMIRGREIGLGKQACEIAALLEERDLVRGREKGDIDIASRLHLLHGGGNAERGARARIVSETRRLERILDLAPETPERHSPGILLALAYPERVAQHRSGERFVMASGTGARLPEGSPLAREKYLAIADVDGLGTEARIFLASPVERKEIEEIFGERIQATVDVAWDSVQEAVVAREVMRLGAIVLEQKPLRAEDERILPAMLAGIRTMGLACLPWTRESERFKARSEWIRSQDLAAPEWPDLSDVFLLENLENWLGPFLSGKSRRAHLASLNMTEILRARFTFAQMKELERLAPEAFVVPTGTRVTLDYGTGTHPVLAVRLQEMFGQSDTPRVGGGKIPVQIHLLSPARRPLAVTGDLPSFWRNAYPEVRKQMRGRYPKHYWPENPLEAEPTKRTKRATH